MGMAVKKTDVEWKVLPKLCATCDRQKPLCEFPVRTPGSDDYRPHCKKCWNGMRRGDTKIVKQAAGAQPVSKPVAPEREQITDVEEHRLKIENRELRERNAKLIEELSEGGEYNRLVQDVLARQASLKVPRIAPRETKSKLLEGTPLVLASDWHVETRVLPERVAGRNRFNIQIAEQRVRRFFQSILWSVKHQRDAFKIRDLILWLGGDLMTNFLHEDDVENNELPPLETVMWLFKHICAGIDLLLTDPEIEQFTIPMNDGNHGRTTKKMRAATRTQHSLEVLLYGLIAQKYENEKRLRFILPTSQFTFLDDVYGRTIRFFHGDVVKYGGGVGGITVPLFRALARFEKLRHADLSACGHFHQRYSLPDLMVNGSLIGYDAYAMSIGAGYEPPVQSLRMLEPVRWCSIDIPLWISKIEDDINNQKKAA